MDGGRASASARRGGICEKSKRVAGRRGSLWRLEGLGVITMCALRSRRRMQVGRSGACPETRGLSAMRRTRRGEAEREKGRSASTLLERRWLSYMARRTGRRWEGVVRTDMRCRAWEERYKCSRARARPSEKMPEAWSVEWSGRWRVRHRAPASALSQRRRVSREM